MADKPKKMMLDAFRAASSRKALATGLSTRELRDLDAGVRARSVFTARGASVLFADSLKRIIDTLASGESGEADARVAIIETLRRLEYTPEGGFPDVPPGTVPPAIRGSLEDLSSPRRINLIVRTQIDLMAGAGQQWRGHQPDYLAAAPAWELIRYEPRRVPRDWHARWKISGGDLYQSMADLRRTGEDVQFRLPTRMIALKGDPVWGELGGSGNFSDALDVDYPPFAIGSGMGWRDVMRDECELLGVTGPDGVPMDDFLSGIERPRVILGTLPLPTPQITLRDVDPEILEDFKRETHATPQAADEEVFDYDAWLEREIAGHDAAYYGTEGKP